jgi:hypothetical protein
VEEPLAAGTGWPHRSSHGVGLLPDRGTHTSKVAPRFQNHALPFFSRSLCFVKECR